jgi:sulfopyruvate decarboxylase alpha subunit
MNSSIAWPRGVFEVLSNADVRQVAYVPDAGHAELIRLCGASERMQSVSLTTEEEGIAMLAGAWLGGQRGVLLMQSSGVGNCINMLGMIDECRFPLLAIVTMRGNWGEFNPWQAPMGRATPRVLEDVGIVVHPVDDAGRVVETVLAASRLAFNSYRACAVLISQRVTGTKVFVEN